MIDLLEMRILKTLLKISSQALRTMNREWRRAQHARERCENYLNMIIDNVYGSLRALWSDDSATENPIHRTHLTVGASDGRVGLKWINILN